MRARAVGVVSTLAVLAALLVPVLMATRAGAGTTTVLAVADTYTRSDVPTGNYGTSVRFSAQGGSIPRQGYLRFDVAVPDGATVAKATLRLWTLAAGTATGVSFHGVSTSWSETGLTWANAPEEGTSMAVARSYPNAAWIDVDVSSLVRSGGPVGIALTSSDPAWFGFASREAAEVPRLVLETVATSTTTTAPSAPTGGLSALHSTPEAAFVDANGTPVRLVAVNLQPVWASGGTWGQSHYDAIRAKGFNSVRMVLFWDLMEPSRGAFSATHFATLDTAIARAKAAGLYVVLDAIHLYGSGGFNDVPAWAQTGDSVTTVQTNGGGYLKELARRYRAEPAVAGYDLVNEFYRFPIDQNGVLRAYDSLIREVRTVDPDKIIVIEPTYGDTSIAPPLADFANLTDKRNVVWSIHDYFAGGEPDGYSSDGQQRGTYLWDGTTGYTAPDPAALEAHLLVHLDALRGVLPLWIGEFGIGDAATNRDLWIQQTVSLFQKYGLGYAWWEYHTGGPLSATTSTYTWKPWVDLVVAPGTTPPPPTSTTTLLPPTTTTTTAPPPDTTAPAAPTGLTGAAGRGSVALDWADNREPDLATYRVYRRNSDGTWPATPIATVTSSAWTDGRSSGTWTYRVAAVDRSGNASASSSSVSVKVRR